MKSGNYGIWNVGAGNGVVHGGDELKNRVGDAGHYYGGEDVGNEVEYGQDMFLHNHFSFSEFCK